MLAKEYKIKVNKLLNNYFHKLFKEIEERKDEDINTFYKILKDFILRGGKRIRPAVFFYTYLIPVDKKDFYDSEEIAQLSIFFEFVHAYLLIHDDIIDDSDLRRGKPTVHIAFSKYLKDKLGVKNNSKLGRDLAILLGDLSFEISREIIMESSLKDADKLLIAKILNSYIKTTIYGQIWDVMAPVRNVVDYEYIKNIYEYKTAYYTFVMPIMMASKIRRIDEDRERILYDLAINLGILYQLVDDYIGIFGDPAITGKSNISDLIEGKRTFLVATIAKNLSENKRQRFLFLLNKEKKNKEELNRLKDYFNNDKVLKSYREYVHKLVDSAYKDLESLNISDNTDTCIFYKELISYLEERSE